MITDEGDETSPKDALREENVELVQDADDEETESIYGPFFSL